MGANLFFSPQKKLWKNWLRNLIIFWLFDPSNGIHKNVAQAKKQPQRIQKLFFQNHKKHSRTGTRGFLEVFRSFVSVEGHRRSKKAEKCEEPIRESQCFCTRTRNVVFLVRQEKSNHGWSCINKNNSEPRSVWRKNRRRTKFTTRACGQIWSNYDLIWVFKGKFSEST